MKHGYQLKWGGGFQIRDLECECECDQYHVEEVEIMFHALQRIYEPISKQPKVLLLIHSHDENNTTEKRSPSNQSIIEEKSSGSKAKNYGR